MTKKRNQKRLLLKTKKLSEQIINKKKQTRKSMKPQCHKIRIPANVPEVFPKFRQNVANAAKTVGPYPEEEKYI